MKPAFSMCMAVILVAAASVRAAENAARFEVAGPQQVVDGWMSSSGGASFTNGVLRGRGAAWRVYDRCLLRFDLGGIDAVAFGRVGKAVLRIQALEAENPAGIETQVAPCKVPWTAEAKWVTPDGAARWPHDRNRFSNIDYAADFDQAVAQTITQPGTVEFDVTPLVNAWLYEGVPNHGLLLRTGKTIFGNPGAGSWTLDFAASESEADQGPALIVELEGVPPTPDTAEARALALYPSPLLPPVANPVIVVWYGLQDEEVYRRLPSATMTTYSGLGDRLSQHGVLNLGWGEGGPAGWLASQEAWERYYVGIAGRQLGYCMHEWHMSSDTPDAQWAVAAVRAATQAHPACYAAFFYQGQAPMARLVAEGHLDLNILQGYTHVTSSYPTKHFAIGMAGIKGRIDVARKAGSLEGLVVMLGHIAKHEDYHQGYELTEEVLDAQIAELRAYAPQMPGIAFYYSGGADLAARCDALARKYFIDPAPDVVLVDPRFETTLTAPHVTVRAQAEAKAGAEIVAYRWFIDNRLVAETTEPEYLWDTRGEHPGYHFITVHVRDSAWNRAAAQILVTVRLPGSSSAPGTRKVEARSVVETADVPVTPAAESTIVGTWELTTTSSGDRHTGELTVNADHSGTYEGPEGKLEISGLEIKGDKVSFRIVVPSPGDMFGDVKTDLKGVLQGDTLKGEWVNYRGGGPKEVAGRRIKN